MKLEAYRLKHKLSRSELAEHLGLSQSYVSQILRGDRIGSIKTARKIQERTGGKVKAADILGI
jgi:transcriptional regulator with XRE-family HTH domain